jgi:DNA replication and repair protein RecF
MGFERLRFFNFRNLRDAELELGAPQVHLVGGNGQGKTNLIEAVHLLCLGSSFREKREAAFLRNPDEQMGLHGRYRSAEAGEMAFSLISSPGKRKEIRMNEKPILDRRELLAAVLCVSFVQQDMGFICGPPEERRKFFDQTLSFYDFSFLDSLRGYRQVLSARNFCLKSRQSELLDPYDEQLASFGLELQRSRQTLVRAFNEVFCPLFQEITGEDPVEIRYVPSWQHLRANEEVVAHLGASRGRDLALGATASGPHRDAFSFVLGGRDYSHFGSTGQLRLCALALRIAQARFLTLQSGRRPVLLLDDVLLELDSGRKKAFVARFPAYEQAFFTFLPEEAHASYATSDTLVLNVLGGEFHR